MNDYLMICSVSLSFTHTRTHTGECEALKLKLEASNLELQAAYSLRQRARTDAGDAVVKPSPSSVVDRAKVHDAGDDGRGHANAEVGVLSGEAPMDGIRRGEKAGGKAQEGSHGRVGVMEGGGVDRGVDLEAFLGQVSHERFERLMGSRPPEIVKCSEGCERSESQQGGRDKSTQTGPLESVLQAERGGAEQEGGDPPCVSSAERTDVGGDMQAVQMGVERFLRKHSIGGPSISAAAGHHAGASEHESTAAERFVNTALSRYRTVPPPAASAEDSGGGGGGGDGKGLRRASKRVAGGTVGVDVQRVGYDGVMVERYLRQENARPLAINSQSRLVVLDDRNDAGAAGIESGIENG